MPTVITFGTFDLLHIGHVRIIERAKAFGDKLVVGVSSDALNVEKKHVFPIYDEESRMQIIQSIKGVDEVFLEGSLELKRQYILDHKADILVMGNDWEGKFDFLNDICKVVYLPRTKDISSTNIKEKGTSFRHSHYAIPPDTPSMIMTSTWPLTLDRSAFSQVSQVVLSINDNDSEMVVRFTVQEPKRPREERTCIEPSSAFHVIARPDDIEDDSSVSATAEHVGCIVAQDTGVYVWHYYVATLPALVPNELYAYAIGQPSETALDPETSGVFEALFKGPPGAREDIMLLTMGDTGTVSRDSVLTAAVTKASRAVAVIHVGDMSYVSNSGSCYWFAERKCQYDCKRDEDCAGRSRQTEASFLAWDKFFAHFQPLSSRVPIVTSMGNHDNDLQWFFKFRPPHRSTLSGVAADFNFGSNFTSNVALFHNEMRGQPSNAQQALLNELVTEPIFFSVNIGPYHIVSLQSGDNGISAYERAGEKGLDSAQQERFDWHFGEDSAQMRWLHTDLAAVDRMARPWLIVFTHRPPLHTSKHHRSCSSGGDWFRCLFRNAYMPVFERYGVNVVLFGHSHHYQRSTPVHIDEAQIVHAAVNTSTVHGVEQDKPVYAIVGTGGFELSKGFTGRPDWIAERTDEHFGYATMLAHNESHLGWSFHSSNAESLDNATFRRYTVHE